VQEDAQDDEDAHREELRLPVLERLIPEIRLLQMLDDGLGRLLMPRASSLASLVLPTAWSPNDSRNRLNSALHSELKYSYRTAPPRRTSITPEPRKSHVLDVKSGRRSVLCRGRFNGPHYGESTPLEWAVPIPGSAPQRQHRRYFRTNVGALSFSASAKSQSIKRRKI
jgi:hypothetical protein